MERKIVERRTVIKGGAAALGMLGSGASTSMLAGGEHASADRRRRHFRIKFYLRFNAFVKPFQPTSITNTSRRSSYRFF
jgi:hypothetical protein